MLERQKVSSRILEVGIGTAVVFLAAAAPEISRSIKKRASSHKHHVEMDTNTSNMDSGNSGIVFSRLEEYRV